MDRTASGVFTLAEARDDGLTVDQVKRRCRTGVFIRVLGDGWVHRDQPIGIWQRAWAAQLTRPDGVIGGSSAAILHGFPLVASSDITVILARRARRRDGMTVVVDDLAREHVAVCDGLAVTSPARTAYDCLRWLEPDAAMSVLSWTVTRGIITYDDAQRDIARHRRRAGNPQLRAMLTYLRTHAASPAERRWHRSLVRAGVVGWCANAPIWADGRIIAIADTYFADIGLDIEIDSVEFHSDVEADSRRDRRVARAGITTWRIPAARVFGDSKALLWELRGRLLPHHQLDRDLPRTVAWPIIEQHARGSALRR